MEPLLISEEAKGRGALADLMRSMDCYCSNLIDGAGKPGAGWFAV